MSTHGTLRYVDPRTYRGPIYRAYVRLASSRLATWLSKKAIWSAIRLLERSPRDTVAMTVEQAHHPVFARIYTKVAALAEGRGGAEHRRTLLAGLSGRVIEVGAGSGANFAHYPTTVSEVVAVEPEGYLRERAQAAAANAPVAVSVLEGGADQLPGEAASFDAGIAALVLCTVPDQARALAELFRVIRPGGELRFYEHVISKRPWEARFQRFADATFWPRLAGGCHLTRDTTSGIERAGFVIEVCQRFPFSPAPLLPADPHILGTARRPAPTEGAA